MIDLGRRCSDAAPRDRRSVELQVALPNTDIGRTVADKVHFQGAGREDDRYQDVLVESFSQSELLQRVTGAVAILLYQMEVFPDGTFLCHQFIGLESIIGEHPAELSPEEAYDAAVHPDDREAYDASLEPLLRGESVEIEYRVTGYDGSTRWVFDRMHPRRTDGRLLVDGVVADITDRKRIAEELAEARALARLAHHDPVTDLPNRVAFEEHLTLALARGERYGSGVAVLFIDLDNFKLVNDSFGHAAGDELLCAVASRLRGATRAMDVVARQGGDEFLILLSDLELGGPRPLDITACLRSAEVVAYKVRLVLSAPFLVAGTDIFVTASIGISLFPADAEDAPTLLKHADIAMYAAKDGGRDGHKVYDLDSDHALDQLSMAARLRKAIERGQGLLLHYQPIVTLEDGAIVGTEALVRWEDEERGLVAPLEFIPLAERIGLVGLITDWVIDESCRQAGRWQSVGVDVYVSINLPFSCCEPARIRHLLETIDTLKVEPERVMVEITEAAVMADVRRRIEPELVALHRRGVKLAIDDFGTGHSSLGRLNQEWVSMLKIDRSFVQDVPESEQASRLVTSIIQLAHTLGLEPVAEGIETEAQHRFLLERGCRLGQGFYFSRPVPVVEVERLLRRQHRAAGKAA
jgi:diguanylate cyclase (GGDEF)-like protein/PAS domain S-box-containing protein